VPDSNPSNELISVAVLPGVIPADIFKSILESYGIPVFLRSDTVTNASIRAVNVGPMGEVRLMVPAPRSEEARAILKDLEERDLSNEDTEEARAFREAARQAAMEAEALEMDPEP
jgi:hypothetical protein